MRRSLATALAVVLLIVAAVTAFAASSAKVSATDDEPEDAPIELVIFHGEGCGHCARMLLFLDDLRSRYPTLAVSAYEVWNDSANLTLFHDTLAVHGDEVRGVPTVIVGDTVFVGDSSGIEATIEATVMALVEGEEPPDEIVAIVDVPLLGEVDVGDRSMLVATMVIGFVDGVNPCSLWVLSMLLALVLHSGSRTRIFLVGGLFLTVTSLLYGLYMVGAYSTLEFVGHQTWIRIGIAAVAGAFGVLHLKEHWTTRGPSLTISAHHKPGLYHRMRGLADPDRSFLAVMGGTAALAVGVSLVETPCTAGLPLLWTNLVSDRNISMGGAAFLFAVYLTVFLADELIIFGAAVVTMRATKLQEEHGRALQLISGTLMLSLAVAMLFAPSALETVSGTAAVFGTAGAICATVLIFETWWDRHQSAIS